MNSSLPDIGRVSTSQIGGLEIPVWVSWLALVVSGALAYFGFRQNPERAEG